MDAVVIPPLLGGGDGLNEALNDRIPLITSNHSGGENISSIEVENVLHQHPSISEAAVRARTRHGPHRLLVPFTPSDTAGKVSGRVPPSIGLWMPRIACCLSVSHFERRDMPSAGGGQAR